MTVATNRSIELQQRAAALNEEFEDLATEQILSRLIHGRAAGNVAVISSFGAEAAVLLHLVAGKDPATPVIFLETRKHFRETIDYVDDLMDALGLTTLVRVRPRAALLAADDPSGNLHQTDSDRCCYIRKTLPMIGVLRNYDCVLTGRKRFQTAERSEIDYVEVQEDWLRINPLADWDHKRIKEYLRDYQLIRHPLVTQGYSSIGCAPCTVPSDDYRGGRWADEDKTECGIHIIEDRAAARITKRPD